MLLSKTLPLKMSFCWSVGMSESVSTMHLRSDMVWRVSTWRDHYLPEGVFMTRSKEVFIRIRIGLIIFIIYCISVTIHVHCLFIIIYTLYLLLYTYVPHHLASHLLAIEHDVQDLSQDRHCLLFTESFQI